MYSSKLRIRANEVADVLSYDSLTRKRTVLETYLLAELKQLQELENHYNQSLLAYKLDLEYLKKFKSTVKNNELKYNEELERKREELNLSVQNKTQMIYIYCQLIIILTLRQTMIPSSFLKQYRKICFNQN